MNNKLILTTLKSAVNSYPDILIYLKGMSRWYGEVYVWKAGEAPDDDSRVTDEKRLHRKLKAFLSAQKERVIREVKDQYKAVDDTFWNAELQSLWEDHSGDFVGILLRGVDGGLELLDEGLSDLVSRTSIERFILDYASRYRDKWLRYINETTRKFVANAIQKWLASGDPLSELVKLLSDPDLHIFSSERARRIAVTEVTRLYAQANRISWEATGYIDKFRWNTANDELVCPICRERHGKEYPLSFIEDNMPAHPNCRCWATPIVNTELLQRQTEELWRDIEL